MHSKIAPHLFCLGLLLATTACTAKASQSPSASLPGQANWSEADIQSGKSCGANQLARWIGSVASEETVAMLRQWRGDGGVRVLGPNSPMTMDYRPDRLNVHVDEDNVITGFRCV